MLKVLGYCFFRWGMFFECVIGIVVLGRKIGVVKMRNRGWVCMLCVESVGYILGWKVCWKGNSCNWW